ncbi:hypothetical protein [Brevundimonas sp. Root1279]|uniref:hypothetical protein n=1 Tax=Brevundimonas sp. Root1279 TaxID=1736443 RepID=UPI0006F990F3|nr:hypothetical protein [Brevundimonas sp. Root1279]KQW78879.1 hypothetical protein ASC65_16370 [Brevundimonas sp. Root1279]
MAEDPKRAAEAPHFETDAVQADRAREQGLGLGERELKAQRDPGGVRTPDEDADVDETGASSTRDPEGLDQTVGREEP